MEGVIMKSLCRQMLIVTSSLFILSLSMSVQAGPVSETELITELSSPQVSTVTSALLKLEKQYPTSTNALPAARKLLTDTRPMVQRKAARYLGAVHAKVDETDLKIICALLTSADPKTVMDGLKALRGFEAPQTVPQILPCLKNSDPFVMRDACRTLAVLGNKDVIPAIEPLLTHPNKAVQKDAQDAIFTLRNK
jgi:HEAT repeat protein